MYCNTNFPSQTSCNTMSCLPPLPQYTLLYCDTTSPTSPANLQHTLVYCNTVPKPRSLLLQYKLPHAAIQTHQTTPPRLQYNWNLAIQFFIFFYHSLGSSPKTVPASNFFFFFQTTKHLRKMIFFTSSIFFSFICYWRHKKNTYPFFFLQYIQ